MWPIWHARLWSGLGLDEIGTLGFWFSLESIVLLVFLSILPLLLVGERPLFFVVPAGSFLDPRYTSPEFIYPAASPAVSVSTIDIKYHCHTRPSLLPRAFSLPFPPLGSLHFCNFLEKVQIPSHVRAEPSTAPDHHPLSITHSPSPPLAITSSHPLPTILHLALPSLPRRRSPSMTLTSYVVRLRAPPCDRRAKRTEARRDVALRRAGVDRVCGEKAERITEYRFSDNNDSFRLPTGMLEPYAPKRQ
jgi:hypothetical protein